MRKIGAFFSGFFCILLLVFILFVLTVNFCGRGVCDQPWFLELHPLKTAFAREIKGPKIVIIGGSSSLFGIDGEKLKEYTGMENINFSMSIMIPMRFYLAELDQFVGEGDVVVMPLELTNHWQETAEEKNFSAFAISLLFGCQPDTQKTLTFPELCSLYFQYGYSWINTSLFHDAGTLRRIYCGDREKQGVFDGVCREEYVLSRWRRAHQTGAASEDPTDRYFYGRISRHGDWIIPQEGKEPLSGPYDPPVVISDEFLYCYGKIQELVRRKKATLLLVWTNNYFYAEQQGITAFQKRLASHGIMICGRPEAMAFPKTFYHDPTHHMNAQGAELWTYELAKTICQETGKKILRENRCWPYQVFADDPGRFFPDAGTVFLYETGVRITQKEFSLVLPLPEKLRGKEVMLSLIAMPEKCDGRKIFSQVTADTLPCTVEEHPGRERMEAVILIPAECTKKESVTLKLGLTGETIGMERSFLGENPAALPLTYISGFSIAEEWGRWSDGPRAELSLAIPEKTRHQELELHFDVKTFVCPGKPHCRIRILSRGKLLYTLESDNFETAFTFRVPPEMTGDQRLGLTFEIEDPRSPAEFSGSADTRKLGIGIKTITLRPASKE